MQTYVCASSPAIILSIVLAFHSAIVILYTDRGVLASGIWRGADTGPLRAGDTVENGFALWADSYDDQSDADRAAHKAVPIQVGLVLAGSIESIVITVNVMV